MSEFLDQLKLSLEAGNGGNGCVSFRKEKFVPHGGPNGGKGGKGGDIIFCAERGLNTLAHIRPNATIRADKGANGGGTNKTGAGGTDSLVRVPLGTIVRNIENGETVAELLQDGENIVIAAGGNGGLGNGSFATATNRTPRFASPGKEGVKIAVELELKMLADVGIIGLPNAGKSTLTGMITAARPAVGAYPFTTLHPALGVVNVGYDSFVIADIPGLIEGAHKGVGLGHRFLKHIERTRILLHLVDIGSPEAPEPAEQVRVLENELAQFHDELAKKPKLLVGNKMDLNPSDERLESLKSFAKENNASLCLISGATKQGIDKMIEKLFSMLNEVPRDIVDED